MPARSQHGGLTPKMRVYFPQFVTVNNPRLACLYWFAVICIGGYATYQFIAGKRYLIKKLPEGEVSICSHHCRKSQYPNTMASQSTYCGKTHNFDPPYKDVKCAAACSATQGEPCFSQDEAIQYSPSTIFVPTFVQESHYSKPMQPRNAFINPCSTGYKAMVGDQVCERTNNYFIPNVEDQEISFSHRFNAEKPKSVLFGQSPDAEGDSMSDLATMVYDAKGGKKTEFAAGAPVKLTVGQILDAAGLHEVGEKIGGQVAMDAGYSSRSGGVTGTISPTPRLTGILITAAIGYSNEGFCQLNLETEQVKTTGTTACLAFRAKRQWTKALSKNVYSLDRSNMEKTYSGILIDFHIHGSYKFADWSRIFRGITTIVIWLGIPIWVLYYFSLYFLGQLSTIYNRVIHQELSLSTACVGLAARLISHTSAFADVQDQPDGLSKERLHERFQMIMQFSDDLDDHEVRKFVDFIYEGVAIASAEGDEDIQEMAAEAELIDVQDFCTVCLSNEPITFDALVKIFDRDRRLGTSEMIFCDEVLSNCRSAAANDKMKASVENAMVKLESSARTSMKGGPMPGAHTAHSLQKRADDMEAEIHEIHEEISRITIKQKSIIKQVSNAEESLKKMGGHP